MSASTLAQARNWTIALAGGGAALLLVFLALNLPLRIAGAAAADFPPLTPGAALRVSWSGGRPDAATAESAQLMDPTPLFMPTAHSVANKRFQVRQIGDKFPVLTPANALKFQAGNLRLDQLPPPVNLPAGPAEALEANPPGNLAMGFGRTDQTTTPLSRRQAWVQIAQAGSNRVVLRSPIPPDALADLPDSNWAPIRFSATVNAAGLVGSVIPMPGLPPSGGFSSLDSETVQELAKYLEVRMLVGQRLAPGFYRILIGP